MTRAGKLQTWHNRLGVSVCVIEREGERERGREGEREREGERGIVCMCVHLCGWLAGGHEAESRALLKTICFPAESEGRLDTVS